MTERSTQKLQVIATWIGALVALTVALWTLDARYVHADRYEADQRRTDARIDQMRADSADDLARVEARLESIDQKVTRLLERESEKR